MDPENTDDSLEQIVASIEEKLRQLTITPDPGTYTICPFPDVLAGIDDGIRSPQLASFGPCHCRKDHLLSFEIHKLDLLSKFLSRTQSQRGVPFYVRKLNNLKDEIKRCYSPKFAMPPDKELVEMMMSDGCSTVELFRQYDERMDLIPPSSPWPILTLISDLLKLENQLPFFVLEKLFKWSNVGQHASPRTLPDLALRFLSQAFCKSSEMVYPDVQEPKHLLDLFRRSLLPATNSDPQLCKRYDRRHSIQSVKDLRSVGITVAKSLLEIDFRKFQIPPLALKIPPLAIDDFSKASRMNPNISLLTYAS